MITLVEATRVGILRLWPQASYRCALLDVRNNASCAQPLATALQQFTAWLVAPSGLALPAQAPVPAAAAPLPPIREARDAVPVQAAAGTTTGVARAWLAVAPLLGSTPKTLANQAAGGWDPSRADHRWLAALCRQEPRDALAYHERTQANVTATLARLANEDRTPDVADALLLFSLLALWQRRRPTQRVRANRRQPRPRSQTPKPAAALSGLLLQRGQLTPLLKLACEQQRHDLAVLVLESAFTEAHLSAHRPTRRSAPPPPWHERLAQTLDDPALAALIPLEMWAHRLAVMRAYRLKHAPPPPPPSIKDHPHILARQRLLQPRDTPGLEAAVWETLSSDAPGTLMLRPQLHRALARLGGHRGE